MPLIDVKSEVTGSVWKILKQVGEAVAVDEELLIVESMKMEIPVIAENAGTVRKILVEQGQPVAEGQAVAVLEIG
jgi:acetyl-CoA carboxylase biotin carboxyl carrier protein